MEAIHICWEKLVYAKIEEKALIVSKKPATFHI
jgi:hypothetical protein